MKVRTLGFIVIVSFSIIGCSSTPLKESSNAQNKGGSSVREPEGVAITGVANFAKPNGSINITFDSKGNWESISSIANGGISANTYEAKEQATTIATMRAKRNIAEFLTNQLSSTKTIVVVSKTLQKAKETTENQTGNQPVSLTDDETKKIDQELKDNNKQVNLDRNSFILANSIREQISSSSNAILRGVTVTSQSLSADGKSVQVELHIVKKNIGVANSIRLEML